MIVEDGEALRTIAAYIDLNPVRAGLCDDPKDYRWCGYAEAAAGSKRARRGLCRVLERPLDSWDGKPTKSDLTAAEWYRCWLFGEGLAVPDESGREKRPGDEPEGSAAGEGAGREADAKGIAAVPGEVFQ